MTWTPVEPALVVAELNAHIRTGLRRCPHPSTGPLLVAITESVDGGWPEALLHAVEVLEGRGYAVCQQEDEPIDALD